MWFGGEEIKVAYDKSRIVILPVPFDMTSTWIKGSDKGPKAVIEASANVELYDIETDSEVWKEGIFTDKEIKEEGSEEMIKKVKERVSEHLQKNKFTVVIGGEHSVSIGTIKAHAERFKDFSVLQLDAHADLRNEYEGSKYNHACVMARVKEVCSVVQVGIRSMDASEKKFIDKDRVFFMKDIYNNLCAGKDVPRLYNNWIDKVISKLSENVYITIDLDVFDSSLISAGTPEPGGFFWWDILELLKRVIKEKNIVGFDVVELCPQEGNKASDFLAAKLIYKILSYKFNRG